MNEAERRRVVGPEPGHPLHVKPLSASSKEARSGVGPDSFIAGRTPEQPIEAAGEGHKPAN